MRQLVEFGLNDGGMILVEVHETASATGPVTRDLCGGHATERARQTVEDAVQRRTPAQAIITRLRGCPRKSGGEVVGAAQARRHPPSKTLI
jgi:hypothetical protein